MFDWRSGIQDAQHRSQVARAAGPHDPLTIFAYGSIAVLNAVLTVVLTPIELVTTFIGGLLIFLTFGLFAILLTAIWLPLLALLLGSSWLWLKAWYLRPLLLIPGVILAILTSTFVGLAPEPERDAKYHKLSLAGDWPFTWYFLFPPVSPDVSSDDELQGSEEGA